ncbi:hypothetical protein [Candidatus Enterococcus mangumiae]|uniref:WxL domain-containing protein n=1 Tax=Candidatus Enterococcus mangumiae TaxID=2230878 RepID=A0ABZ2SZV4_9ENTE|nr:hypothetical protein [Enterococcus sp. DIV1094]MBO0489898.1 hypothetical protein [Enterococcus sp. DIV1094]
MKKIVNILLLSIFIWSHLFPYHLIYADVETQLESSDVEAITEDFLTDDRLNEDQENTEDVVEEVNRPEESDDPVVQSEELITTAEPVSPYSGTGTSADPFTTGSATELITVLQTITNTATLGPYYISLTANIVYQDTNSFSIDKDVVIDGQGFYMLYSNSSSTSALDTGFRAKTSGVTVTLRNINFGSDTLMDANNQIYANSTYYGIIGAINDATTFHAILENVNYYAQTGAQPFISWNQQSTFTFQGENTFVGRAGTNSQEFLEGYNVIFAEESKTTIDHQTTEATGLFYAFGGGSPTDGRLRITIEENAEVEIISTKPYFTYDSNGVDFTISDSARLYYTQVGANSMYFSNIVPVIFTVGSEAQVSFVNTATFNSGNTVTFNVNAPDYIRFKNAGSAGAGLFSTAMTFNRQDSTTGVTGDYRFSYLNASSQLQEKEVAGPSSSTLNNSYFSNPQLMEAIYQKRIEVTDWSNVPDVAVNQSELTTTINSFDPPTRTVTTVEYKLSEESLWTGAAITDAQAQTAIENATLATNGVIAVNTSTEQVWTNEELQAGTYYVYVKLTGAISYDPDVQVYTTESMWFEAEIVVPKSPISVEVPLELIFGTKEAGAFSANDSAEPIVSQSNFPIDFTVTEVTDQSDEATISLVDQLSVNGENELILNLSKTDGQSIGPMLVGENEIDAIGILPFWETSYDLYLSGEFSGPIFNKHHPSFLFTYLLTVQ